MGAPQIIYIILIFLGVIAVTSKHGTTLKGINNSSPISAISGFFVMYGLYYWGGFFDYMQYEYLDPNLIPQYTILSLMVLNTLKTIVKYKKPFAKRVNMYYSLGYMAFSIYMLNAGGFFN